MKKKVFLELRLEKRNNAKLLEELVLYSLSAEKFSVLEIKPTFPLRFVILLPESSEKVCKYLIGIKIYDEEDPLGAKLKISRDLTNSSGMLDFKNPKFKMTYTLTTDSKNFISEEMNHMNAALKGNQQYLQGFYKSIKLGQGGYGTVHKFVDTKDESKAIAVKQFKSSTNYRRDRVLLETQMQLLATSPGALTLIGFHAGEDARDAWIATELCSAVKLGQFCQDVNSSNVRDLENTIAHYFYNVFCTINFMHKTLGLSHGDIKPENILVSLQGRSARLADFGFARPLPPSGKFYNDRRGTPVFMAPEVNARKYTEKCDLWALGMTLFNILSGDDFPFSATDFEEQMKTYVADPERWNIFTGSRWKLYSPEIKDLIKKLLVRESDRLTALQAISHPWFDVIHNTHVSQRGKDTLFRLLKTFRNNNNLKNVNPFLLDWCFLLLVSKLPVKNADTTAFIYQKIDTDHSGYISLQELIDFFMSPPTTSIKDQYSKEEEKYEQERNSQSEESNSDASTEDGSQISIHQISKLMDTLDIDKNGQLDYSEFCTHTVELNLANVKKVFNFLDTDGDKVLTRKDFSSPALTTLFMDAADINGDKQITMDEFLKQVLGKVSQKKSKQF